MASTMKYKLTRVYIMAAIYYGNIMRDTIPYMTAGDEGSLFVGQKVRHLAPRPPEGAADGRAKFEKSQMELLEAWCKAVVQQNRYRIEYNDDGNYVVTVDITLKGPLGYIEPFKKRWPASETTRVV